MNLHLTLVGRRCVQAGMLLGAGALLVGIVVAWLAVTIG